MDSSDKKTHRIDAGGDSAESSKSVSKAEGGANKSVEEKDAEWGYEPGKAGMALEARLGMAVIAVLVAVFGFLVYRNFDLKQQQIAAIKNRGSGDETEDAGKSRPPLKEARPGQTLPNDNIFTVGRELPDMSEPEPALDDTELNGFEETSLTLGDNADGGEGETDADSILDELLADSAGDVPEFDDTEIAPEVSAVADDGEPELFPEFPATDTLAQGLKEGEDANPVLIADSGDSEFSESAPSVTEVAEQNGGSNNDAADDVFAAFPATEEKLEMRDGRDEGTLLAPANTIDLTPVAQTSGSESLPEFTLEADAERVVTGPAEAKIEEPAVDVFEEASGVAARNRAEIEPAFDEFDELLAPKKSEEQPQQLIAMAEPQTDNELLETFGEDPVPVRSKSPRPAIDPALDQVVYDADPVRVETSGSNTVGKQSSEAVSELCDICEARQDDNYWKISKRMYGTARYFSALALFNKDRIPDPRKIRPGMKILVPEAKLLERKYPELFRGYVRKPRKPSGFFLMADGTPAYRVGERETLSEISQKHLGRASRWIQIWRLNQSALKDPKRIQPGTVIALPDDATNVGVAN